MISEETINILRLSITTAQYFFVLPVQWDATNENYPRIKIIRGLRRQFCRSVSFFTCTWTIWAALVVCKNLVTGRPSALDVIFGIFFVSVSSMATFVYLCMLFISEDVVRLINSVLQLNHQICKLTGIE